MAGDVLFRLKLGIEPVHYRLAAIPFLLATIPLGSGVSGMAQLVAIIAVFVAVLFLEKRVRAGTVSPLPDDHQSVQPDSAPHTSPGRPRIWRTAASASGTERANVSVSGSKRTSALAP